MQCRTRDMMVCQGAEVSGAAVSLNNVSSRLRSLIAKLVQDYSITEADMEVCVLCVLCCVWSLLLKVSIMSGRLCGILSLGILILTLSLPMASSQPSP